MTDPVVRVANHSTHPVCIARDPNWDDQVLLIDGSPAKHTLCLSPDTRAEIGIALGTDTDPDAYLMGVIFSDGRDFDYGDAAAYQTTIGQNPETGLLGITDQFTISAPSQHYAISNQTQWSMGMTFKDS